MSTARDWSERARRHFAEGAWQEAARACQQAVALDPRDVESWRLLGQAELECDQLERAQRALEQSLALAPHDLGAQTILAFVLNRRGQPRQAIALLERALARAPQFVGAWLVKGHAHEMLGEGEQARAAFEQGVALDPQGREARYLLAKTLWHTARAEALLRKLVADEPSYADAWALLGTILQARAKSPEAIAPLARAVKLANNPIHHSTLLLAEQYVEGVNRQQLLADHRQWNAVHAGRVAAQASERRPARDAPLKIGLVSADFGKHPTGFLVLPAIEVLDKSRCSVTCYSDRFVEDEFGTRFRRASTDWRPTSLRTDQQVADQIRQDQIDVLVDLMGHTNKNRMLVFAQKPAPVQITWFGYVGTTGLAAMDYLLADRFHVPPGEESDYSETVLRMPHGYACYGPPADAPPVAALPASTSGHVTIGCFNNPAKYSPRILDAWATILNRVPSARLLLKYSGLDESDLQSEIRIQFHRRGISESRIDLEGWSANRELMSAYNRVDLVLDTQPYSGGVTTCDALWMGVPVITWPGETFAGRHAVSHMNNAGFGQFVAADLASYIELAAEWASRLEELAKIRAEMRERVRQSPLCDARRFAEDWLRLISEAAR